jgi:DNA-binding transcriptional ArsR family regulator
MRVRVLWGALASLLLAGCGSRGPDEGELRVAIDAHLATTPKCIGDVAWRFPAELRSEYNPRLESHHAAMMARIEALERVGLVRSTGADEGRWGKPVRYELSEAGRQVYREFPVGQLDPRKPAGGFCYGTAEVDSIIRHTEPAEGAGQVQTEVTYTYRLRDVAAWAKDAGFLRLNPEVQRELGPGASRQAQAVLVRASDGWRVAALP